MMFGQPTVAKGCRGSFGSFSLGDRCWPPSPKSPKVQKRAFLKRGGGLLYLRLGFFFLTLGLCYLRWSFLLTVEIWFGLFYLRLKFGLVFFAYGGKSDWSFYLRFPLSKKLGLVFFTYGSPTVSKKDEP